MNPLHAERCSTSQIHRTRFEPAQQRARSNTKACAEDTAHKSSPGCPTTPLSRSQQDCARLAETVPESTCSADPTQDLGCGRFCESILSPTGAQKTIGNSSARNPGLVEHRRISSSTARTSTKLMKRPHDSGVYLCMYVCMYVYIYACMYVCMYVCMYKPYI